VIRETMAFQQLSIPTTTIYYYSKIKAADATQRNDSTSNALTDAVLVKVVVAGSLSFVFMLSFYDYVSEHPQHFRHLAPMLNQLQQRIPLYVNHVTQPLVSQFKSYFPYFKVKESK
jgi:GrpB-like predicted nucleotidyltransferase (UPF0157 family)